MCAYDKNSSLLDRLNDAYEFAQSQVENIVTNYPDRFPMYTRNGRWFHSGESWTHWCDGFLGGMMWIFHRRTQENDWLEKAKHYSLLIENRKTDRNVHDLGFLFWSTWKRWYDLSGETQINQVVITAGKTMGRRFQEKGKYLCSFIGKNSLFIDIMMNIGIVFYAGLQTNDKELLAKAHQHCQTTRRYLVRGDGSTAHEGLFDLETGEFLRQSTHQGYRGDSAWARGQAWALYGFGTAYALTGNKEYLTTACTCADYYLNHCSFKPDAPLGPGIPPNDFDDPRQPTLPESSAAAIAASGLFNLVELVKNKRIAKQYKNAALTILDTLSTDRYLARSLPGWEGILLHGIYHLNKGLGVDESMLWGDYFFVEALDKAMTILEQEK
jgi:unsaturated chondroitin disaccharide hydrolase